MKLVSIIMPYFKKKRYFKKSINSALNQTYKNFEILIIYDDDNKKDLNYVMSFKKIDERIKVLVNPRNLGAGYSRNKGIENSKGHYIAFLDCDDYWYKNKLKKQITFMNNKKLDISHTGYDVIDDKDNIIGKMQIQKKLTYSDLLKSCDVGLSSVVIKKNVLINKKFPKLKTKEDYTLWLKISKEKSIYGLMENLSTWRNNKDSLSDDIFQKIIDAFKVFYYFEKKNILHSVFYTFRLSFYAICKKIKIYSS
tara:strand:+ start:1103 stop:1858 length:756 start_codon:yes stop_codon:yes gene_type:complete